MKINDIIFHGGTFQGRLLSDVCDRLLSRALRTRDEFLHRGLRPSGKSINEMATIVTEIKQRCEDNLTSRRPRKIAETVKNKCDQIFSVLSEIDSSVLDEDAKEK